MKMLTVVELEWDDEKKLWSEEIDYTFVNPDKVLFIKSVPFDFLDLEEGKEEHKRVTRFGYKVHLVNGCTLNVIALDRELFYSTLTGA